VDDSVEDGEPALVMKLAMWIVHWTIPWRRVSRYWFCFWVGINLSWPQSSDVVCAGTGFTAWLAQPQFFIFFGFCLIQ
jgi:hypothetical protein